MVKTAEVPQAKIVRPTTGWWRFWHVKSWHTNPDGTRVTVPSSAEIDADVYIDRTAKLGEYVQIGRNTTIGVKATISEHCKIGSDAFIGDGTFISEHCKIGSNTRVGDNCVILRSAEIGEFCEIKFRTSIGSKVVIGHFVFINVGVRIHPDVYVEDRARVTLGYAEKLNSEILPDLI